MDLAFKTQNFTSSDQSWVVDPDYAGKIGATIDLSKFGAAQLTGFTSGTQGILPSGLVLGRVTATGKVGPYDDSKADGTQTVAGILWDDVPFVAGQVAGNLGGSIVVFGMAYVAKLPLASAAVGTPGRLDANGQADSVAKIVYI